LGMWKERFTIFTIRFHPSIVSLRRICRCYTSEGSENNLKLHDEVVGSLEHNVSDVIYGVVVIVVVMILVRLGR
jgi:hypothetical protein